VARLRFHPRKDHRGFDLISDALPFGLCIMVGSHVSATLTASMKKLRLFISHSWKDKFL
jgi:hypothetical protein